MRRDFGYREQTHVYYQATSYSSAREKPVTILGRHPGSKGWVYCEGHGVLNFTKPTRIGWDVDRCFDPPASEEAVTIGDRKYLKSDIETALRDVRSTSV